MQRNPYDLTEPAAGATAQRLGKVRTMVVLWLVVLALGIALIPLIILSGWVRGESARLQHQLADVQNELIALATPAPDVVRIHDAAAANEATIAALQAYTVPVGMDWPRVAAALADYDPLLIRLTAISQRDDRLRVIGRALSNDAVIRYEARLLDSGVFRAVVILSQVAAPTPVPDSSAAEPFGTVDFEMELVVNLAASAASPREPAP